MKILTIYSVLFLFFGLFSLDSVAGLYVQHAFNYNSDSDDSGKLAYSSMRNITFIGAAFGSTGKWIIGQNIMLWNRSVKNDDMSSAASIDLKELGPRFQYFFNESKTVYISGVYNFYVKGKRKVDGTSQDVSGTSFLATIGTQLKISKKFYFGVSLNYHSISLSEKTVDTTTTDITDSMSYIFPAVAFSLRFK